MDTISSLDLVFTVEGRVVTFEGDYAKYLGVDGQSLSPGKSFHLDDKGIVISCTAHTGAESIWVSLKETNLPDARKTAKKFIEGSGQFTLRPLSAEKKASRG